MVCNGTPHTITFKWGDIDVVIPPSGYTLDAKTEEVVTGEMNGVRFVKTVFRGTPEGWKQIEELKEAGAEIIIGSIISTQAYPEKVVGMTPIPGYERVPVDQKRMNPFKFIIY